MTREEAIRELKIQFVGEYDRQREAKDIAIKALEQELCEDAISRKAAIDAMREETCGCCWDAKDILEHLPSVNPQASKEDIHREREQAYMRGYEDASRKYRIETCEDAISRQAAIDAMATWDWQELYLPIHFKQLLEDLPSVSTEKTGRWIAKEAYSEDKAMGFTEQIVCSNCDMQNSYFSEWDECKNPISKTFIRSKYCPNCGAKMQEVEE